MTKITWSKANDQRRILRQGRSGATLEEMPWSWEDMVPQSYLALLNRVLRSVIVAEINGVTLPVMPEKLKRYISGRVEKKGGVLAFAKWMVDYDAIKKNEAERKNKARRDAEEKVQNTTTMLLHRIAKYELRLITLDEVVRTMPRKLRAELSGRESLTRWARLQPSYVHILGQKVYRSKRRKSSC